MAKLFLFVSIFTLVESSPLFSTICDSSSKFTQLENFIGSIHVNAPADARIRVFYDNLTKSQVHLLSLYRNVELVSLKHSYKPEQYIPITDELIDFHNELFLIRDENNSQMELQLWPYIDSIQKKIKLAIVIPFIRTQMKSLADQFNMTTIYAPCRSKTSADLILYHDESSTSLIRTEILQLIEQYSDQINGCYQRVRIFSANLIGSNDSYLLGSGIMWKKLIDTDEELALSSFGYTHFFIMEADTWPVRSHWLDGVHQSILDERVGQYMSTPWWILGSAYRGRNRMGPGYTHVNGNALYHLSSNFIAFVRFFWPIYLRNPSAGYDYVITYQLANDIRHEQLWKKVLHRFRYSDFIQNCWHTGCGNNVTEFAADNPRTYLVHGGPRWTKTTSTQPIRENAFTEKISTFSAHPSWSCVIGVLFILSYAIFMCRKYSYIALRCQYMLIRQTAIISQALHFRTRRRSLIYAYYRR